MTDKLSFFRGSNIIHNCLYSRNIHSHKYFERPSLRWNITDFLRKECDLEPFKRKIEFYIASLEIIIDMEKDKGKAVVAK